MDRRLLAVDVGLRAGLAWYDAAGRLTAYRSTNFGSLARVRRGAPGLLEGVTHVVLEGGGQIADAWMKAAGRLAIEARRVSAETWREALMIPRERRTGAAAKDHADAYARAVIAEAGLPRPTSLRHDAAEAILTGRWAVETWGWRAPL